MRGLPLLLLSLLAASALTAQEFSQTAFPPEFALVQDVVKDELVSLGNDEFAIKTTCILDMTARCSLEDVDQGTFTPDAEFSLAFGNFGSPVAITIPLSRDPDFTGAEKRVRLPIYFDDAPEGTVDDEVGAVEIAWTAAEITFRVTIASKADDGVFHSRAEEIARFFSPIAAQVRDEGQDDPDYGHSLPVTLSFAGRSLTDRTVEIDGTCSVVDDDPRTGARITAALRGSIDSVRPVLTLASPTARNYTSKPIPISGTARDAVGIQMVEVDMNGGGFEVVDRDDATGAWSLSYEGALIPTLKNGNKVTVRTMDINGLVAEKTVSFTFVPTGPALSIRTPAPPGTVRSKPLVISGTVTDADGVTGVEVDVNGLGFRPVETLTPAGAWSINWSDGFIPTRARANRIEVRATDGDGNVTSKVMQFTYVSQTALKISVDQAAGGGGSVSGTFGKKARFPASGTTVPGPVSTVPLNEGVVFTATATPLAGSVFDGWVANKTLPMEGATAAADALARNNAKLVFKMQPSLELKARFILNPFLGTGLPGSFGGIALESGTHARGFFKATVSSLGSFSGSIRVGVPGTAAVVIPVAGRLTNGFVFPPPWDPAKGIVRKGKLTYAVSLQGSFDAAGNPVITGTVSGGNLPAGITFGADRAAFSTKALLPAAEVGTYNAVIDPPAPPYPAGAGWGRLTVAKTGTGRFVGKLGDGTKVTIGAAISKRDPALRSIPFYASLYKGRGAIAGVLRLDPVATPLAFAGPLGWARPAGSLALPFAPGFETACDFASAKWTGADPFALFPAGALPEEARVQVRIAAPASLLPGRAPLAALPAPDGDGTFDAIWNRRLKSLTFDAADNPWRAAIKVSVTTGLFTGSYVETLAGKSRTLAVSGILVPGLDGRGQFLRGDRTGAVTIAPRP